MKYKTLAELKAAYDSGEIPRDWVLMIDNDNTNVYEQNVFIRSNGSEVVEAGEKIFEGGMPEDLLTQALDLLGIPNEPA
jgi:hypothetical protein